MTEFNVKEVTIIRVATFWAKYNTKYNFFRIYEILHITNSANLDCQMWLQ